MMKNHDKPTVYGSANLNRRNKMDESDEKTSQYSKSDHRRNNYQDNLFSGIINLSSDLSEGEQMLEIASLIFGVLFVISLHCAIFFKTGIFYQIYQRVFEMK